MSLCVFICAIHHYEIWDMGEVEREVISTAYKAFLLSSMIRTDVWPMESDGNW